MDESQTAGARGGPPPGEAPQPERVLAGADEELLDLARHSRDHAHAVHSRHPVGAALRLIDGSGGRTFAGSSVENVSFPVGLCAERAALAAAVSSGALQAGATVTRIRVLGPDGAPCPPCGACRQWFVELAPDAMVVYPGHEGVAVVKSVQELLPDPFTS